MAINRMPINIAARTDMACNEAMTSKPKMESAVGAAVSLPSPTTVPWLGTTMPASRRPMKAMNMPIPPPTAANSERGSALMIKRRTPARVSNMKATPEMKTQPNAVCQGRPIPFTTVKVK